MNREALEHYYRKRCAIPDNLGQHLPILRALAEECKTVVEFGVQKGRSTVAFLLGCPGPVYSYDLTKPPSQRMFEENAGNRWIFQVADSRTVDIPECDLLFIDTDHTYEQLKAELVNAVHKVRRYVGLHDTVIFGHADASGVGEKTILGTRGLLPALAEYLSGHLEWKIKKHYTEDRYGLLVLERLDG